MDLRTYTWEGPGGPFTLLLGERVFAPTRTSAAIAGALRINDGDTVIDVGCGSGVLSVVAARLGAQKVYATDLNDEAVTFAQQNVRALGLADRIEVRHGSLFDPLDGIQADVVIGDVAGIPDEIAEISGWYPGGFAGGPTGAEVPAAMVERVGEHLRAGGRLYLPTGSIQHEGAVLRAARRVFGEGRMRTVRELLFPLPAAIAEHPAVQRLMQSGTIQLIRRGSRLLWELRVWECTKKRGASCEKD